MGCGRLFEGDADQMFANMQRFKALSDDTTVYCAHEYTQSNGRFALVAEPDNVSIVERMKRVDAARARGAPTVPTTIAAEKATNHFLRAASASALKARRVATVGFREIASAHVCTPVTNAQLVGLLPLEKKNHR